MATVVLPDNGQRIPLDDTIAGKDDLLQAALRPVYPDIGQAQIKRETVDGEMVVTVVKRAGTKGVGTDEQLEQGVLVAPIGKTGQITLFDYQSLDANTRAFVRSHTAEIKTVQRRMAGDIIQVGRKLIEVKERLGHGKFGGWLLTEFEWSQDTANNFMRVAQVIGDDTRAAELAPSVLYLLSAPSTPEAARTEVLERVEGGETVTTKAAREIVDQHKEVEVATTLVMDDFSTLLDEAEGQGEYPGAPEEESFTFGADEEVLPPLTTLTAPVAEVQADPVQQADPPAPDQVSATPTPAAAPLPTPLPTPAPAQAPTPAAKAIPASSATPTAPAPSAAAAKRKPLSFEQSTIKIDVTFMPDEGDPEGRLVVLTAMADGITPVIRFLPRTEFEPLPPVIMELLHEVATQLGGAQSTAEGAEDKAVSVVAGA